MIRFSSLCALISASLALAPGVASAQFTTEAQTASIALSGEVKAACTALNFINDIEVGAFSNGAGEVNVASITSSGNNRIIGPLICNGTAARFTIDANPITMSWNRLGVANPVVAQAAGFTNRINYIARVTRNAGSYSSAWDGSAADGRSDGSVVSRNIGLFNGTMTLSFADPKLPSGASRLVAGDEYSGTVVINLFAAP